MTAPQPTQPLTDARAPMSLADLAGSCAPAPVPEGVTPREEAAAKWLHDARELLAAVDEPKVDWADLREMARNAGWTAGTDKPVPSALKLPAWIWGRRERGWLNNDHGWIRVETMVDGRWRIDVIGPAPHPLRSVSLVAPTPAEILTAARLVGLVGAS